MTETPDADDGINNESTLLQRIKGNEAVRRLAESDDPDAYVAQIVWAKAHGKEIPLEARRRLRERAIEEGYLGEVTHALPVNRLTTLSQSRVESLARQSLKMIDQDQGDQ